MSWVRQVHVTVDVERGSDLHDVAYHGEHLARSQHGLEFPELVGHHGPSVLATPVDRFGVPTKERWHLTFEQAR